MHHYYMEAVNNNYPEKTKENGLQQDTYKSNELYKVNPQKLDIC